MAVKVTKGQICSGTISKIKCHKEYYLYGKFHKIFTNSTVCLIFWTMPLYYIIEQYRSYKIQWVACKLIMLQPTNQVIIKLRIIQQRNIKY